MTAHYIMVGGFLGAGKTTALLRAGRHLVARGLRAGLIINDQSEGLVDTAIMRASRVPVQEVAGGCFCCRFNSLVEAAARLSREGRPDVFLAEPVGSCTDLNATVILPLRHLYGHRFNVAPLSVLLDPDRALRVLGLAEGRSFSDKVLYVYRKQMEEADVLVINKVDTTDASRVSRLREALARTYPTARVVEVSARTGHRIDAWIDGLLDGTGDSRVLDIDYDTYAEGEALLGWLNCTVALNGAAVDADELLSALSGRIHAALAVDGLEIAHLKLTLVPSHGSGIAVINAVRTDRPPELAFALDALVEAAEITLNLRAEADPERLAAAVRSAIDYEASARGTVLHIEHLEHFRPGRPVPTHRMAAAPRGA
jgi:Ni2+-binding GTPase involved in maturation of urease and hydrogenase